MCRKGNVFENNLPKIPIFKAKCQNIFTVDQSVKLNYPDIQTNW